MQWHPFLNASLNALAGIFLVAGFRAIRRKDIERHKRYMIAAFATSGLFLVSYLLRFALSGSYRFPVEGGWKSLYLLILLSHSVLAAVLLPLVLRTIWLPWRGRFAPHRKIARITFPIWAYVSATGVIVYLMLYHLPAFL